MDSARYISEASARLEGIDDPDHDSAIKHIRDATPKAMVAALNEVSTFVCSFSRAKNLLSQSRSYGLYVIGFNERMLGSTQLLFDRIYDPDEKKSRAEELVSTAVSNMIDDLQGGGPLDYLDALQHPGRLEEAVSHFKH